MSDARAFWNPRFASPDYLYGTRANDFLREEAHRILAGGRVLSLGDGEGRNGVFLAEQGFDVTALDAAEAGLAKAEALARERGVTLATVHADLEFHRLEADAWDGIVAIFCHLPSSYRAGVLRDAVAALKPGGVLLLEGYTPRQLAFGTGGPKEVDLLYEPDALREELAGLEFISLAEVERPVVEGRLHTGLAAVLQIVARKPEEAAR
ncbi:class I SAM-dependent methyltransferase [Crenobacter cavernae]|uniref:Class I SAM-dependent methyltransferase n=1 Tax=Crenobacter cavernae TaxID=2290923 RepID=A0A345YAD3_9NEIS|nr:class I SAM-dependent methyltransferase [Crenobacter cavernae]AXK40885.1 class I SAM-dependent methyltransferase [Crenobacter cavernae]